MSQVRRIVINNVNSSGEEPVKSKVSKREEDKESEDEFEREMEAEAAMLLEQVTGVSPWLHLEKPTSGNVADVSAADAAGPVDAKDSDKFYDQIYFDSSSDEETFSDAGILDVMTIRTYRNGACLWRCYY